MTKQTHSFQAEVAQLLHLVTHALYSNKEIFLRELISNASDACDKLRFEALNNDALYEGDSELKVRVSHDDKTITISDNGIGMTAQEAIDHLGTIAKSGTKDFMGRMSDSQKSDAQDQGQLIGQFGVGFYSGFIVADKITVESRRAGVPAAEGVRWISGGSGDFEVEAIDKADRGTKITLHLREDANQASALWTRAKKDISDEQYQEFYKQISHDAAAPLAWSHNRVEGGTEYTQLLYLPAKAPFDLYNRDKVSGVKLYVKRVFIMDDAALR